MIIPIHEKKRIRSDAYQWIIDTKTTPKDDAKEGEWIAQTYHSNPIDAIERACAGDVRSIPDVLPFKEAMEEVGRIMERYKNILELVAGDKEVAAETKKPRRTK